MQTHSHYDVDEVEATMRQQWADATAAGKSAAKTSDDHALVRAQEAFFEALVVAMRAMIELHNAGIAPHQIGRAAGATAAMIAFSCDNLGNDGLDAADAAFSDTIMRLHAASRAAGRHDDGEAIVSHYSVKPAASGRA